MYWTALEEITKRHVCVFIVESIMNTQYLQYNEHTNMPFSNGLIKAVEITIGAFEECQTCLSSKNKLVKQKHV